MAESAHSGLTGTNLHGPFHYEQDADPGAVGAFKYWLDTNSGPPLKLYRRNAGDAGWDEIGPTSTGAALTVQELDGAPLDAAVTVIKVSNGTLTDNGVGDVTIDTSTKDHAHSGAGSGGAALTGSTISSPVIVTAAMEQTEVSDFIDVVEDTAPATPSAGRVRLYAKADGSLYQKDDAGLETGLAGGGGAALTVQEIDGAPLDAAVTIIRVTNGKLTDNGAGDVTLDLSGSAGLVEASLYALDVRPTSPHAKDDEFDGTSLDGKWTDPITATRTNTLAVANGWLIFEPSEAGIASTASRGPWGVRQAAPAGSFTISGKTTRLMLAGDVRPGIFVARTASTKLHSVNFLDTTRIEAIGNATYSETVDIGAYDGYQVLATWTWPTVLWFKIAWDSGAGSIAFSYSFDGVTWLLLATRTGQSQPDRIGVILWGNTANILANQQVACDWFRVTEP